jgi:Zn-dependent peptidase ImmA (M78 family)
METRLLKALLNGDISFHELMNAYGINVSIAFNLTSKIYGFVYLSKRDNYYLILNGNIDYKTQCKVFLHEIQHILNDMPKLNYFIGIDQQYTYFENEADRVAEDAVSYFLNQ